MAPHLLRAAFWSPVHGNDMSSTVEVGRDSVDPTSMSLAFLRPDPARFNHGIH